MTDIPQPVSLHSQQSPMTPTPRDHRLRINVHVEEEAHRPDEISPLTPTGLVRHQSSQDENPVSPIEPITHAIPRVPLPNRPSQSQIPRKVVRSKGSGAQPQTKWDEYSGEPTTDDKGKPASVRPGLPPLELQYPLLKERTKQILAGLRERDAARNMQWDEAPPPAAEDLSIHPAYRQPWKGASGRTAIVDPVANTPSARQNPRQFSEVVKRRPNVLDSSNEHTTPVDSSPFGSSLRLVPSEEEIRPTVPLKTGKKIRTPELVTKGTSYSPQEQSPSASPEPLLTYHEPSPETSHHRVESPQHDEEPKTPDTPVTVSIPEMAEKSDSPALYEARDMDREQSRFSWTTYTTSTAESPRSLAQVVRGSSPPPPIPDLPPSIKIKKRPVSSSPFAYSSPYNNRSFADSTGSVIRKPLPGVNPRSSSMSSAASRAMSTSKSLPPTPTVLEASDKIESFDAQLEALNRRKHNVNRIISSLEASLKKNAIVYDMWKRREVEKNITNHRLELDDITREIHDISLQRNRTQRRRDRDDGYEACTGLWIKRVTS